MARVAQVSSVPGRGRRLPRLHSGPGPGGERGPGEAGAAAAEAAAAQATRRHDSVTGAGQHLKLIVLEG